MPLRQISLLAALALLAFASLLGVVVTKHYERKHFFLSEQLAAKKDNLYMRWESLQLERSAQRTEGRVERIARTKLDMHAPGRDEIVDVGGGD